MDKILLNNSAGPGLEVIKLEFKIKCNDWLLADTYSVRKQPIIALYFEFETVLKFYNLGARALSCYGPHNSLPAGYFCISSKSPSECHTAWIQVGPDLGPSCL